MTATRESFPLSWPDGWTRTRPQDRRAMNAWKRTANQYRDEIVKELERIEAPSFVISSDVPLTSRDSMTRGIEPLDVGVAIYFSRKINESWFGGSRYVGAHSQDVDWIFLPWNWKPR